MLENKSNDVEMGLLNDSTQNLHEETQIAITDAKEDLDNCEFNVYKDIKKSP